MINSKKKFVGAACALSMALFGAVASADVIYSTMPASLPGSLPSIAYYSNNITEIGQSIQLGGTARALNSVTVTMVDWSMASTFGSLAAGYDQTLTFNIYNYVDNTALGSLIATLTQTALVPWRPKADPTNCGVGATTWYSAADNTCYNGYAFNVTFDFSSLGVILPNNLAFGLSTATDPSGSAPNDSLNYAVTLASPSVGAEVSPGAIWVDGLSDTASGYIPVVTFNASVPEPTTLALAGLALFGIAATRRRVRR
ncbi:MAG TPA: PEP-CTERM sorting domain-containing protein [Burkholderiaceae bacterium]